MKALVVTLFAIETNTSVSKSNYGLIKGLIDNGFDIDLVMPEIDSNLSYYDDAYDLSKVSVYRIPNENVGQQIANRSKNLEGIKKKIYEILRDVYLKTQIFDRTTSLVKKVENLPIYGNYYDLILSTSDPKTSHLCAKELIKKGLRYGKWIQHWGDPLSGDISKHCIWPECVLKKIEKKIMANADGIVYVSPFTCKKQVQNLKNEKLKIIFAPLPYDEPTESTYFLKLGKKLKIAYLGDYSSNIRNIVPLYNSVNKLENVELVIAGNSDISLQSNDKITVYPRVSQQKVKEIEANVDVIVSVGNLNGTQIPGKIYYAASTNKIILVTVDGKEKQEMINYFDSYKRYICCENNEKDISKTLLEILDRREWKITVPEALKPANIVERILNECEVME